MAMTIEKLKQTIKLADEIQMMETFYEAFHGPCMKGLLAYRIRVKEPVTLSIKSDSELFNLIDDYLKQRLSKMKKQFEEM